MKFIIARASDLGDCTQPCKGSSLEIREERKTIREVQNERGGLIPIEEIRQRPAWSIEIDTIEDLMQLINEVGSVILDRKSITIYDDYVE